MSVVAKHIKKGNYLLLDKSVCVVLDATEITSNSTHTVKLNVENFETNHHTTVHFGLSHNVRTLEPEVVHYDLVDLADCTEGEQFLSLMRKDTNEVDESVHVNNPQLVKYLQDHFSEDGDKNSLSVHMVRVKVDSLHRTETDRVVEKVTGVEGFDMKHLYDHHHNKHHTHHA